MKKITTIQTELTKEQLAYAKRFAKQQTVKFLSTKQYVSDKTVELYVRNAYKVAGVDLPKKIVWFDSPESFCKHYNSVRNSVRNSVGNSVENSVRNSVRNSVENSVWNSVRNSVRNSVWNSVWNSVGNSVRNSVENSVWNSVWNSVENSVRNSVRNSVDSGYWASAYSFYKFWHKAYKENDFFWVCILAENTTGFYFGKDEVWLVRKPTRLTLDDNGRLHSEDKKAIEWTDGFGFYYYHGIEVPEKWIKSPSSLNKKDWSSEDNLEKRRVIQEIMGDSFPKKIGAKMVGKPSSEFKNKHNLLGLYEVDLPDDPEEKARYVKVKDHSSNRMYFIRVKPTISDADEALASTFQLSKEEYVLAQEA